MKIGGVDGNVVWVRKTLGLSMGCAFQTDVQTFPNLDGCRHVVMYVRDLRGKCRG